MRDGFRHLGCFVLVGLLAACGAETKQPSDGSTGGTGGENGPMTGGMGDMPTAGNPDNPGPTTPTGPCTNDCLPGTPARCNNTGIETCVDANFDGCYEWSQPVPCADGLSCSNGACSAECQDECEEGLRDCGMVGVRVCAKDHDGDPCTDWGPEEACPDGEFCSGGRCSTECQDECDVLGQPQCDPSDATKFRLCGQLDSDPCLELGDPIACGEGETCSNNRCAAAGSCTDECTEGQVTCNAERTAIQTCAPRDVDMCLTYSNVTPCGDAETCCSGACVDAGQACNECEPNERRCEADGYQVCEEDENGNRVE